METLEFFRVLDFEVFLFVLHLDVFGQVGLVLLLEHLHELSGELFELESYELQLLDVLVECRSDRFLSISRSPKHTEVYLFLDQLLERLAVGDQLAEPHLPFHDHGGLELEVQQHSVHHSIQVRAENLVEIVAKEVAVGWSKVSLLDSGSLMRSLQESMIAQELSTISNR
jgi:hypothetical protein